MVDIDHVHEINVHSHLLYVVAFVYCCYALMYRQTDWNKNWKKKLCHVMPFSTANTTDYDSTDYNKGFINKLIL